MQTDKVLYFRGLNFYYRFRMKYKIVVIIIGEFFSNFCFGQIEEKTKIESNENLIAILDTIHEEDQKYRDKLEEIEKIYGWDSDEVKKCWAEISIMDSINLVKVENIITEFGWLSSDEIGEKGNLTLFLVIQHSNTFTQQKYLPILKDALTKGNAKPNQFALLQDRVLVSQGEKQIYGSQLYTDPKTGKIVIFPLIDPDNVDKRRAEMKLEPISEYLKSWGIGWDVEEFKKQVEK